MGKIIPIVFQLLKILNFAEFKSEKVCFIGHRWFYFKPLFSDHEMKIFLWNSPKPFGVIDYSPCLRGFEKLDYNKPDIILDKLTREGVL